MLYRLSLMNNESQVQVYLEILQQVIPVPSMTILLGYEVTANNVMEIKTALNNVDFCIFSSDANFWIQWVVTLQEIDLFLDTASFVGKQFHKKKKKKNSPQLLKALH